MTKYILLLIVFVASLTGCTEKKISVGKQPVINLSDNVEEVTSLPLSDAAARMEIVPLELTDSSLIAEVTDVQVTEHNIWVRSSKSQSIFRFSREGKFLNKVGRIGQGPGEYSYLSSFMVDDGRREVYLTTISTGVYAYDFNGVFKRTVAPAQTINTHFKRALGIGYYRFHNYFLATASSPIVAPCTKDSLWSLAALDSCFQIRKMFRNPAYEGHEDFILKKRESGLSSYWVETIPSIDSYNGRMTVKFDNTDTLYAYDAEHEALSPQYVLFSREDKGNYEETHQWLKTHKGFNGLYLKKHYDTKDYIYLTGSKSKETRIYCCDKHSGKVRLLKGEGEITERPITSNIIFRRFEGKYLLTNDLCGGVFQLDYRSGGKYWVNVFSSDDEIDVNMLRETEVKDSQMRDRFVKELENLRDNEDSNPLLLIVTLK